MLRLLLIALRKDSVMRVMVILSHILQSLLSPDLAYIVDLLQITSIPADGDRVKSVYMHNSLKHPDSMRQLLPSLFLEPPYNPAGANHPGPASVLHDFARKTAIFSRAEKSLLDPSAQSLVVQLTQTSLRFSESIILNPRGRQVTFKVSKNVELVYIQQYYGGHLQVVFPEEQRFSVPSMLHMRVERSTSSGLTLGGTKITTSWQMPFVPDDLSFERLRLVIVERAPQFAKFENDTMAPRAAIELSSKDRLLKYEHIYDPNQADAQDYSFYLEADEHEQVVHLPRPSVSLLSEAENDSNDISPGHRINWPCLGDNAGRPPMYLVDTSNKLLATKDSLSRAIISIFPRVDNHKMVARKGQAYLREHVPNLLTRADEIWREKGGAFGWTALGLVAGSAFLLLNAEKKRRLAKLKSETVAAKLKSEAAKSSMKEGRDSTDAAAPKPAGGKKEQITSRS